MAEHEAIKLFESLRVAPVLTGQCSKRDLPQKVQMRCLQIVSSWNCRRQMSCRLRNKHPRVERGAKLLWLTSKINLFADLFAYLKIKVLRTPLCSICSMCYTNPPSGNSSGITLGVPSEALLHQPEDTFAQFSELQLNRQINMQMQALFIFFADLFACSIFL